MKKRTYFTVGLDLILKDEAIPYDLFINSSKFKEHFVRIFPQGDVLTQEDLDGFIKKYHQVYLAEDQRGAYLKSLAKCDSISEVERAEIIKDSAIKYLGRVFDKSNHPISNEILDEAIEGCKDTVASMAETLKDFSISKVQKLIGSLSFHDFYTYDHSINVAMYNITVLKALKPKATKKEIQTIGLGGLLHDLGKIKISNEIINSAGELPAGSFDIIKKHPEWGSDLLLEKEAFENESFDDSEQQEQNEFDYSIVNRIILEHHENFNGTGYPNKIEGENIHLYARITSICDFYDAITTKRSYHEALSTQDALAVMENSSGKKIDPKLFDVFSETVNKLKLKGKSFQELPDDFDPCQPQNILPFKKKKPKVAVEGFTKDEKNYGKVKKIS